MGVGELNMDLRGRPKNDYSVRIRGGVGEATVRLPSDVGVSAEAHGGIGDISARGMRQEGSRYYNEAYGRAKPTIRLDIQGGVGSIKLISD
jgi:predicted membrane protein